MPLPPTYKFRSIPALIELYTKFGSDPGRNQDAVLVSPSYIPHIFLNLISVCTAQYAVASLFSFKSFQFIKWLIISINFHTFFEPISFVVTSSSKFKDLSFASYRLDPAPTYQAI